MSELDKLFKDYDEYIDSLEHAEDGDYTTFIWNYPEAAIAEYGEKLYEVVTNYKLRKVYKKLEDMEQDFA